MYFACPKLGSKITHPKVKRNKNRLKTKGKILHLILTISL